MPTSQPDAIADRRLALLAGYVPGRVLLALRGVGAQGFTVGWPGFSETVAAEFMAAQVAALAVVEDCLSALVGAPVVTDPAPYVGRVGARSLDEFLAITPDAWAARVAGGLTPVEATVAQANQLAGSVATDVHAVARNATIDAANADPRFTGWARVAEPGACDWCRMLAGRGAAYESKQIATRTAAGKRYHRRCRCTARAMPRAAAVSRKPRSARERAVAAVKPGPPTPERADFLRRQIGILARLDNDWARAQHAAFTAELAQAA